MGSAFGQVVPTQGQCEVTQEHAAPSLLEMDYLLGTTNDKSSSETLIGDNGLLGADFNNTLLSLAGIGSPWLMQQPAPQLGGLCLPVLGPSLDVLSPGFQIAPRRSASIGSLPPLAPDLSLSTPNLLLSGLPSTDPYLDRILLNASSPQVLGGDHLLEDFSLDLGQKILPTAPSISSLEALQDTSSSAGTPEPDGSLTAGSPPHNWQGGDGEDDPNSRTGDLLSSLTPREREILISKGFDLCSSVPLTAAQEKRLRQERRKIRNKESAKESRRKKAEYLVGLEKRAEAAAKYQKRCEDLEKENAGLSKALQQLQVLMLSLTRTLPSSTSLPLMMLLCTFCFAFTPSLLVGPDANTNQILAKMDHNASVKSRVLLSIPEACGPKDPTRRRRSFADRFTGIDGKLKAHASRPPMEISSGPEANSNESIEDPSNDTLSFASLADTDLAGVSLAHSATSRLSLKAC